MQFIKGRILKLGNHNKGYLSVNLRKNNKLKTYLVHRIIAEVFLPNPNNYKEVNHKDEDKTNNSVENLEWCDRLYNVRYGTGIERRSKTQSKPVLQYDLEGNLIREWKSVTECGMNGYNYGNVAACCRGELKTYKGFLWEYK